MLDSPFTKQFSSVTQKYFAARYKASRKSISYLASSNVKALML
ncbi:Hypothetical protein ADU71_0759 [Pediococcus damnosus]|nr:Hypothetical protein ADU71_0759 [Pediococcus damnosus]AMV69469.1 Hypothetical protein ADU73_1067 [Pediococcus damnosus]